ncbi:ABC transporter ATP-binding protein [Bradyrhizobium sp. SBR1B]|uniref:ABC transporter ATP-binding protein n=1 Tax=Bradyrhizobium sp. SBR1B TaxID=2663836 RepID=UPI001605C9CB|nr:ABC transporter ATP-binding protein [Bradyrhizobium sp. SBR1B]MBB4380340.1 ABC-type multidrug transport system fused ATPase/permease subunit [Bradyrhizobium sp. SBR1B]
MSSLSSASKAPFTGSPAEQTNESVSSPASEILQAYWRSDRRLLLIVAALALFSSASSVAGPYVFSYLIDRLSRSDDMSTAAWGFAGYAVLIGVASAFHRMLQNLSFMTAENLGFIAATRFFDCILKKTPTFFLECNPAEIQSAAARGRSALMTLIQLGMVVFIPASMQLLLTLFALGALLSIQIAAIVAVYGAIAISLTWISTRKARVFVDAAVEAGQKNARFAGNVMNAMDTLRHFGSHSWMNGRFTTIAREVRDSWRAYVLQRLPYIALLGLAVALQFAVTLLLLIPQYHDGTATVGDIVLFNTLLLQLNMPFDTVARGISDVARSRADLIPLGQLWAAPEERKTSQNRHFKPSAGRLSFEGISYAYDDGRGVTNVSFRARRGRITFLVGETGSGKSTIFKLALKSIEPDQGRILVDDIELATIDRADWYAAVAVVPQDVMLLNESLADNILLGRPRDEVRLRGASKDAAILPLIEGLPEGFETTVGERGLKLSGGERQRIAVARALYGQPAILLLDEASSALDERTERDIMDHIRTLAQDVTVLAITHRRDVISACDAVVDLTNRGLSVT